MDPADLPKVNEIGDPEFEVLLYEFKDGSERISGRSRPRTAPLPRIELIAFNEQHRDREMPYFGQEIIQMAQKKGPLTTRPIVTRWPPAAIVARGGASTQS